MNPTVKERWLSALRSGYYQQGTGRLRRYDNNTFCCLGVLCDLHNPDGWPGKGIRELYYGPPAGEGQDPGEYFGLPLSVREWADLTDHDIIIALVEMNDHGNSFSQIADYIDKEL